MTYSFILQIMVNKYSCRLWVKRNEKWFENFGGVADEEEKFCHFFHTAKLRFHTPGGTIILQRLQYYP